MPYITLELDATVADIVKGIGKVEAGGRVGLVNDRESLALAVVDQVDRARKMALAAGLTINDLEPTGLFWEANALGSVQTLMRVGDDEIQIYRGSGGTNAFRNGQLILRLTRERRD